MMSPVKFDNTYLSQKILFLSLINERPEEPSRHIFQGQQESHDILRKLTLQREKALAESFAFLASATDDPRKVVAACVEQKKDRGDSCVIRLAVNSGGLDNVKHGFQRISLILQEAASQTFSPQTDHYESALQEAVIVNRNRILNRMRSRHRKSRSNFRKKKSNRPQIIPQLWNALQSTATVINSSSTSSFLGNIERLEKDFADLESMTFEDSSSAGGLEVILKLVKTCKCILSQGLLDSTLGRIKTIKENSKISISNAIKQLGFYATATSLLVDSARKCEIFKNIEISVVKFVSDPVLEIEPDAFTLKAIDACCNQPENCQLLKKKRLSSSSDVKSFISRNVRRAPTVHAEIQLLFFYETNRDCLAPRVICSNKNACYLCRLYFQLHGKFLVPPCHGKIYENWALPNKAVRQAVTAFSKCIESKIKETIGVPPAKYSHIAESVVFSTCSKYSSSITTIDGKKKFPENNSNNNLSVVEKDSNTSHCTTATVELPANSLQGPSEQTSSCDETWQVELKKGSTAHRKLANNSKTFQIVSSKIHILFEFFERVDSQLGNESCLNDEFNGFWVDVSSLSEQEAEENKVLCDLQKLSVSDEATFELPDGPLPKSFYIKWHGELISVTINAL